MCYLQESRIRREACLTRGGTAFRLRLRLTGGQECPPQGWGLGGGPRLPLASAAGTGHTHAAIGWHSALCPVPAGHGVWLTSRIVEQDRSWPVSGTHSQVREVTLRASGLPEKEAKINHYQETRKRVGKTACAGGRGPGEALGAGGPRPADGGAGTVVALGFQGLLSCMPVALALDPASCGLLCSTFLPSQ